MASEELLLSSKHEQKTTKTYLPCIYRIQTAVGTLTQLPLSAPKWMQISMFDDIPAFKWHNVSLTSSWGNYNLYAKRLFKWASRVCKLFMWQRRFGPRGAQSSFSRQRLRFSPSTVMPMWKQAYNRSDVDTRRQICKSGGRCWTLAEHRHSLQCPARPFVVMDELTITTIFRFFLGAMWRRLRFCGARGGWNRHWQKESNREKWWMLHC